MLSLILAASRGVKSRCRNFCGINSPSLACCIRNIYFLGSWLGRLRAAIENYVLELLHGVCDLFLMRLLTGEGLVTENTGCRRYFVGRCCHCLAESRVRSFARKRPIRTREYFFDAGIILAILVHTRRWLEMLGEAIVRVLILQLWA